MQGALKTGATLLSMFYSHNYYGTATPWQYVHLLSNAYHGTAPRWQYISGIMVLRSHVSLQALHSLLA